MTWITRPYVTGGKCGRGEFSAPGGSRFARVRRAELLEEQRGAEGEGGQAAVGGFEGAGGLAGGGGFAALAGAGGGGGDPELVDVAAAQGLEVAGGQRVVAAGPASSGCVKGTV